ncbi:Serine/threonine-protein kinase rio1 [Savitreella phatthalungensis]
MAKAARLDDYFQEDVQAQEHDRAMASYWEDSLHQSDESDSDTDDDIVDDVNIGWEGARGDFTKAYNRHRAMVEAQRAATGKGTASYAPSSARTTSKTTTGTQTTSTPATAMLPKFNPSATRTHVQRKAMAEGNAELLAKLANRLNLSAPPSDGSNKSSGGASGGGSGFGNVDRDKSDRATSEQVLDPRTRIILLKLINNGILHSISGCVSTGKEANVYAAESPEGRPLAVKIYKTSILVFKDRDRYVTGEFRFKSGYAKSNPRKMVKLWAEKEFRNLRRLYAAGIPCPEPVCLRSHVLVMSFVAGKDGWASSRLKDAAPNLSKDRLRSLYLSLLATVRKLWHVCRLVHADLSEYNLLYHQKQLTWIDVSQSVEPEHPRSLEFLRMDIKNVTDFFARSGVATFTQRAVFEFVTAEEVQESAEKGKLETVPAASDVDAAVRYLEIEENLPLATGDDAEVLDDEVFRQAYIPQNLDQVYDYERDAQQVERGEGSELIYGNKLVKLPDANTPKGILSQPNLMADFTEQEHDERANGEAGKARKVHFDGDESEVESDEDTDDDEEDDSEDSDDNSGADSREENLPPARLKRFQDKADLKAHKQQVKAERAEKRKNKLKKSDKKQKIKKTTSKRK